MSVRSRTYSVVAGADFLWHPSISGVRILGVKREGLGLAQTSSAPGNRQFRYLAGRIYIDANNLFTAGEKMWVLYEV